MNPYFAPVKGPNDWDDPPLVFFDDFIAGGMAKLGTSATSGGSKFSSVANRGQWLVSINDEDDDDGASLIIADDAVGGILTVTNNVDALDRTILQVNGEAFGVKAGKNIYYQTRLKVDDADDVKWGCGLATSATTASMVSNASTLYQSFKTSGIGFFQYDADGNYEVFTASGNIGFDSTTVTGIDTGNAMVDDTFVTLAFEVEGNKEVRFYINGVNAGRISTNLPPAGTYGLSPFFFIANDGSNDGSAVMSIDYVYVSQER
jgi:hypothetical protein